MDYDWTLPHSALGTQPLAVFGPPAPISTVPSPQDGTPHKGTSHALRVRLGRVYPDDCESLAEPNPVCGAHILHRLVEMLGDNATTSQVRGLNLTVTRTSLHPGAYGLGLGGHRGSLLIQAKQTSARIPRWHELSRRVAEVPLSSRNVKHQVRLHAFQGPDWNPTKPRQWSQ